MAKFETLKTDNTAFHVKRAPFLSPKKLNSKQKETLTELMSKIRGAYENEEVQASITSLKAEFENLIPNTITFQRVKSPLSALKKFYSNPQEYGRDIFRTKDMIGLMLVVDKNSDVDSVIQYIGSKYADAKNPHSRYIVHDYRKEGTQDYADLVNGGERVIFSDQPTDKGYQTCDGYKNVRANITMNGYPIEIQIKTKEQFIGHEVTHDMSYKSPLLKNKNDRVEISSKLFPYFEALSYLKFHEKELSVEEIANIRKDINDIYNRNVSYFQKYPEIFKEACETFAVNFFILQNYKELFTEDTLTNDVLNTKLLKAQIQRVFKHQNKLIHELDPSLSQMDTFLQTVTSISKMSYGGFCDIRDNIAGGYRLEKCIVSGGFDLIREKDITLFEQLTDSFRHVVVGVYGNELHETIVGKPPIFSEEKRVATLEQIKGIDYAVPIDMTGKPKINEKFSPIPLEGEPEKKYGISYVPGVFDMLHPGHVEYLKKIAEQSKAIIVGLKSDDYVRNIKNKEPVLNQDEREVVIGSLRNVFSVCVTDNDILPPPEAIALLEKNIKNGEKSAIFLGSDWINKPETKGQASLEELRILKEDFPEFVLESIPREKDQESTISSSNYRQQGLESLEEINPLELTVIGSIGEQIN